MLIYFLNLFELKFLYLTLKTLPTSENTNTIENNILLKDDSNNSSSDSLQINLDKMQMDKTINLDNEIIMLKILI